MLLTKLLPRGRIGSADPVAGCPCRNGLSRMLRIGAGADGACAGVGVRAGAGAGGTGACGATATVFVLTAGGATGASGLEVADASFETPLFLMLSIDVRRPCSRDCCCSERNSAVPARRRSDSLSVFSKSGSVSQSSSAMKSAFPVFFVLRATCVRRQRVLWTRASRRNLPNLEATCIVITIPSLR